MSDLLPCPFCGANLTVGKMNVARCKTDGCELEHYSVDLDWKERVDAWNRRAIPAADARAEALKEAEKALRDWQDNLILCGYREAPITVGMAADVVRALIGETDVPRE